MVQTRKELQDQILDMIDRLYGIALSQQFVVMFVAALGVVTALLISVLQRRREMGLLRAIGASRQQVVRSVLAEACLMGIIGTIIGLAVGIPLQWYVLQVVILEESGYLFPMYIPWLAGLFIAAQPWAPPRWQGWGPPCTRCGCAFLKPLPTSKATAQDKTVIANFVEKGPRRGQTPEPRVAYSQPWVKNGTTMNPEGVLQGQRATTPAPPIEPLRGSGIILTTHPGFRVPWALEWNPVGVQTGSRKRKVIMYVAVFSLGLFVAAFLVHWLLWRLWIPRRQIVSLLYLFEGILAVVLIIAWLTPEATIWPAGLWPWLHCILCYEALAMAYIQVYTSLEQDSASLTIVVFVADAGGQGRTRDELYGLIDQDFIIGSRFQSMLHGKLIEKVGDEYRLTAKGTFWAYLFRWYRWLFRLRMGG